MTESTMSELYSWVTSRTPFNAHDYKKENTMSELYSRVTSRTPFTAHDYMTENTMSELYSLGHIKNTFHCTRL